jgi:hypothetical protein
MRMLQMHLLQDVYGYQFGIFYFPLDAYHFGMEGVDVYDFTLQPKDPSQQQMLLFDPNSSQSRFMCHIS